MDENQNEKQQKDYQVVQEKIIPKKNRNIERVGRTLFHAILYGAVFGSVAGFMLVMTGKLVIEKFGLQKPFRQVIGIEEITSAPDPQKAKPTGDPSPVPTIPLSLPVTPIPENQSIPFDPTFSVTTGISETAKKTAESLVEVIVISQGVDWFEETYETRKKASAVCVGNNGVDMLFLANLDLVEGATRYEIKLKSGAIVPCVISSYDTNYRLAALSVRLSRLKDVMEEDWPVPVSLFGGSIEAGIPVFALGHPNGHADGIEVGLITGASGMISVIDDGIRYFTTNISRYADGDGFIFNLSGQILGIISTSLNSGESNILTAVSISGIRTAAEKVINNQPRVYCGFYLMELNELSIANYGLPKGVYVTEVLPGSPALAAGMKNGDIILEVGEVTISDVKQVNECLNAAPAGENIRVVVSREQKGERKELSLYIVPETRIH